MDLAVDGSNIKRIVSITSHVQGTESCTSLTNTSEEDGLRKEEEKYPSSNNLPLENSRAWTVDLNKSHLTDK
jgi:hypothetical protein